MAEHILGEYICSRVVELRKSKSRFSAQVDQLNVVSELGFYFFWGCTKLGAGYRFRGKLPGVTEAKRLVALGIMRVYTFSCNEYFMPKQATGASLQ